MPPIKVLPRVYPSLFYSYIDKSLLLVCLGSGTGAFLVQIVPYTAGLFLVIRASRVSIEVLSCTFCIFENNTFAREELFSA